MSEPRMPERQARLLACAQGLTPPPGRKTEVSGDEIIVTAGPSVIHRRNLLVVRDHPLMHIPTYPLVDPREGVVTLYSEPAAGVHHRQWNGRFGDAVPIPAPFAFGLDTTGLLRHPA